MSLYTRRLMIGLIAGPLVILGLFAWAAASDPSPPADDGPAMASAAVPVGDASEPAVPSADGGADASPSAAAAVGESDGGIRELPQAQGLPDPAPDVIAPTGVRIGDIGVDAVVVPVGVEADGAFEVPSVRRVGWYRFGSGAGSAGSTVLAAHINYNGVDGVFRHLESISRGSEVAVELADGSEVRYRVVDLVEYEKADLPVDELFSESGADRLVLITCGGTFHPALQTYDSNVVAYAEAIDG